MSATTTRRLFSVQGTTVRISTDGTRWTSMVFGDPQAAAAYGEYVKGDGYTLGTPPATTPPPAPQTAAAPAPVQSAPAKPPVTRHFTRQPLASQGTPKGDSGSVRLTLLDGDNVVSSAVYNAASATAQCKAWVKAGYRDSTAAPAPVTAPSTPVQESAKQTAHVPTARTPLDATVDRLTAILASIHTVGEQLVTAGENTIAAALQQHVYTALRDRVNAARRDRDAEKAATRQYGQGVNPGQSPAPGTPMPAATQTTAPQGGTVKARCGDNGGVKSDGTACRSNKLIGTTGRCRDHQTTVSAPAPAPKSTPAPATQSGPVSVAVNVPADKAASLAKLATLDAGLLAKLAGLDVTLLAGLPA